MRKNSRTAFLDMLFVLLMVFILLPHNPEKKEEESTKIASNVIVEAVWKEKQDSDVDLWVQTPGDRPIGFSRKNGKYMDLLRDDLGNRNDVSDLNFEIAFGRAAPEGEYAVNLHLYSNSSNVYPVHVDVTLLVQSGKSSARKVALSRRVSLQLTGEEVTVFRFKLDGASGVVSNVHDIPIGLRESNSTGSTGEDDD